MKICFAVLASLGLMALPAAAQIAPGKTVTIVVPAAPGGVTDTLGRQLAKTFGDAWGQQVIVENKAGANNQLAAEYVAKAPNDGSVLFIGPDTAFTVNPSLYHKLNYDPVKDFTPITGLVIINQAMTLNPSVPANNVKELIALAKQKPGELNYGTFGIGSSGHLNMAMFESMAGVKLQAVHYKGATPALTDVIAGHIQMLSISIGSVVPQWKAGKVKIIAVGAPKRLALLPDVPTVSESGLPGYVAHSWFGLFGPAGMAPALVDKLNGEVRKAFADPEFRKSFLDRYYFDSIAGTPKELADYIQREEPRWRKVIQEAGVKPVD
jgi:tripartite-type tricarboxylate transporter receptor subunit TctC